MTQAVQASTPSPNTAQLVAAGLRGYRDAWCGITEKPALPSWSAWEWEAWEAGQIQAQEELAAAAAAAKNRLQTEYPECCVVDILWELEPVVRAFDIEDEPLGQAVLSPWRD